MNNTNEKTENLLKRLDSTQELIRKFGDFISSYDLSNDTFHIIIKDNFPQKLLEVRRRAMSKELADIGNYKLLISKEEDILNAIRRMYAQSIIPQLKNEHYHLNVIDLLKVLPVFKESVFKIRNAYEINPKELKKELSKLVSTRKEFLTIREFETPWGFNSQKHKLYIETNKKWDNDTKKIINTYNKIKLWEEKKFPHLIQMIGELRFVTIGKVPLNWSIPIKNYILYNEIPKYSFLSKKLKSSPRINIKQDSEHFEPYIQIKIYRDTNINYLSTSILKKCQKLLPNYQNINQKKFGIILKRWIYYILRKKAKLKHSTANELLKSYGFKSIGYQHSSQEIKRFENFFKKDLIKNQHKKL